MSRSFLPVSFAFAAVGLTLPMTGFAYAATSPSANMQVAVPGTASVKGVRAGDVLLSASQAATPAETQQVAQVTISRAADHVGRPVYFSRSTSGGFAGLVSFSSRSLPSDAVFSVAFRAPGTLQSNLPVPGYTGPFSGTLPSMMPVYSRTMTSGFGFRQHPILGILRAHSGVDLAASWGSPIVATSDGVVSAANWAGGYGLLVALDHGSGLQTRYGHMSRIAVMPGQQVRKGEVIGYVGSTGLSTGPHLHYEIRVNGQAVNPASHLHGR